MLGLVSLLALARSAWTLQVVSVQPETLIQTQADFDLDKVSDCDADFFFYLYIFL